MAVVIALITLVAAVLILVLGAMRLTGRRTRLDRIAKLFASAAAQGVYPPSLRGEDVTVPPPPEDADGDR